MKLAHMSKEADKIVKSAREWESKTLNNEVEIEELDKQMREARRIGKYSLKGTVSRELKKEGQSQESYENVFLSQRSTLS